MTSRFILKTPFEPAGDQVQAIDRLVEGVDGGVAFQTLLGVTGSGKTFTMAKVVEATNRPTLVLSHNKTLAAQLYQEFKAFFPDNAVEYFVSYYDYYQPEAYVPRATPTSRRRPRSTRRSTACGCRRRGRCFERRDVLIVASVSCIYGLGSPEAYFGMLQLFEKDVEQPMDEVLRQLAKMQYERTHLDLAPGSFRAPRRLARDLPAVRRLAAANLVLGRRRSNASSASTRCAARRSRSSIACPFTPAPTT